MLERVISVLTAFKTLVVVAATAVLMAVAVFALLIPDGMPSIPIVFPAVTTEELRQIAGAEVEEERLEEMVAAINSGRGLYLDGRLRNAYAIGEFRAVTMFDLWQTQEASEEFESRLRTLEQALGDAPARAVGVLVLREEVESTQAIMELQFSQVREDIQELRWLIGLLFGVPALVVSGAAIWSWSVGQRQGQTQDERDN